MESILTRKIMLVGLHWQVKVFWVDQSSIFSAKQLIPLNILLLQHEAVLDDNYEIALELLSAGAIVNVPGFDFTTPLHAATHRNNLSLVQLLLKFGADPLARDISGRFPE